MSTPLPAPASSADRVGLSWLITVRWTTVLAGAGAVAAGRGMGREIAADPTAVALLGACAASNLWLIWRVRRAGAAPPAGAPGLLVCADVVVLSWLLLRSGGVLNPASVFLIVQIVVAALVLGRVWTLVVTGLSVGGYAALFLAPAPALQAAETMHPEIGAHMRGMWLAFAVTALIIAILVTRLAIAIERRDRALDALRDRAARTARAAGLATLAAGAAHELSTPLATMAVAARELEHRTAALADPDLREDARLIRSEIDRCRGVLDAMAGQAGESLGESPKPVAVGDVLRAVLARAAVRDRHRLSIDAPDLAVVWPPEAVARALGNLVQNALQASPGRVSLTARREAGGVVELAVHDEGPGMTPEQLSRAGEPFFTTRAPGAGTGLGLFVARSSVEQLGGALTLASAAGRGTTATITLPGDVVAHRTAAGHA